MAVRAAVVQAGKGVPLVADRAAGGQSGFGGQVALNAADAEIGIGRGSVRAGVGVVAILHGCADHGRISAFVHAQLPAFHIAATLFQHISKIRQAVLEIMPNVERAVVAVGETVNFHGVRHGVTDIQNAVIGVLVDGEAAFAVWFRCERVGNRIGQRAASAAASAQCQSRHGDIQCVIFFHFRCSSFG